MSDNSLIAPVASSREAWTGSGLADSIEGLVDAIKSEGWVEDPLAGATLGVEVAASVTSSPLSPRSDVERRRGSFVVRTVRRQRRCTQLGED